MFKEQKFLILVKFHISVFYSLWVLCSIKETFAYATVIKYSPLFSSRSFITSAFTYLHFELILMLACDKGLKVHFFGIWIYSCSNTVLKDNIFPTQLPCHFYFKSIDQIRLGLFLDCILFNWSISYASTTLSAYYSFI